MPVPSKRLLIISRDALLDALESGTGDRLFRIIAGITRKGVHILLSAPEPDRWVPTRGNVDHALENQKKLMSLVAEAGGNIEGVYYVPRSLLTQDRNREGALEDILKRYSMDSSDAALISSSIPFINAAERLGFHCYETVPPGKKGTGVLEVLDDLTL